MLGCGTEKSSIPPFHSCQGTATHRREEVKFRKSSAYSRMEGGKEPSCAEMRLPCTTI